MLENIKNKFLLYRDIKYLTHDDISFSILIVLGSMLISTVFSIIYANHITILISLLFAFFHFLVSLLILMVYIYSSIKVMYASHKSHEEHKVIFPNCGLCDKFILTTLKENIIKNENETIKKN